MAAIQKPDWSKLSSLDPELIRAFVAVVESGGFTAAARQLHRTQSTISLRIRTLEERLDTHLFMRNSRRLELSRDGENFLIHARRIIQVQNDAILAEAGEQRPRRRALRAARGLRGAVAADLLKSFYAMRPARACVHCRMSLELLDRLQAGELDVALVVRHRRRGGRVLGRHDVVWPRTVISRSTAMRRCRSRCSGNVLLPAARAAGARDGRSVVSRRLHSRPDRHQDRGEPRRGRDDDRPLRCPGTGACSTRRTAFRRCRRPTSNCIARRASAIR